ncbi:MAG: YkgJ family cysteine cluster protein [Myxococcota bacterium]
MDQDVCRSCGACCAHLRVGFAAWETDARRGTVPAAMTAPWIPNHVQMRGTRGEPPRCVALEGVVGQRTTCTIHGRHPTPCKMMEPSTPERPNPWCDEARQAHGLPVLSEGGAAPKRKKAEKAPEKAEKAPEKAEKAPEKAERAEPPKVETPPEAPEAPATAAPAEAPAAEAPKEAPEAG